MSEKPFERLLIEIGTDTGDLGKTIKELEKLQRMSSKGSTAFSGLRQFIEDAVRNALKPAKGKMGGGGGGGITQEMFDKLEEFRSEFVRMTKDVKGLFGPGRNPANIGVEKLVRESGMGAGSLLKYFIDDKERNASIRSIADVDERRTHKKQDEDVIRKEADAGMLKYFSYAHTPMGKTSAVYKDMTALIAKTPWREIPTSVAVNRQARAIFEDRSEQFMMTEWKAALGERGAQLRMETPLRTVNEEALENMFASSEYEKFKPVLDAFGLTPGGNIPSAIPQWFTHQTAEGPTVGLEGTVFDPAAIKAALLGQKNKSKAGFGTTAKMLKSLVTEGSVQNEGLAKIDALISPGDEEKTIAAILATTGVPEGGKITKEMQRAWLEEHVLGGENLPVIEGKKEYVASKTGQDVYKRLAQVPGAQSMLVAERITQAAQDIALESGGMAFTLPGKAKFREIFANNIDALTEVLHDNPEIFTVLDKLSSQDWEETKDWRELIDKLRAIYDKVTDIANDTYKESGSEDYEGDDSPLR